MLGGFELRDEHGEVIPLAAGPAISAISADDRRAGRWVLRHSIRSLTALGLWTLFAALPAALVSAEEHRYSWAPADAQDGIQVFTSIVTRHNYDAVKASSIMPVPAAQVFEVLRAFERYTSWYHRLADVKVLSEPRALAAVGFAPDGSLDHVVTSEPWILFLRQRTPPLEDRWTLLHCKLRAGARGSLLIDFHSLKGAHRGPEDAVYMDMRGYWRLQPLGAARTEVTFMVDVDPNTAAPAMFVDPELRGVVTETLTSLRKVVLRSAAAKGGKR